LAKALEIIIDQEKDIVLFMGHTFLLKDEIKALPGARWNAKDKVWFAPFSKNSIESLKNHFPSAIIAGAGLASIVENNDEVTDKKVTDEQVDKDYLSVASLLESVQNVFQRAFPAEIKVCGVVRGLKVLGNGRIYFDLYDSDLNNSYLRSVVWESSNAHIKSLEKEGFKLESELPILALGRLSFSSTIGSVTFVIKKIFPEYTKGKLAAQRDATNLRLKEEGVFALNKGKQLPLVPIKLGLLTSKGGTVINDFLASLADSEFGFDLKWYPVRVQGQYAVGDLLEGLKYFNSLKDLDAIIIFRGGGSVGDLQVFNEYQLAKAVCLSEKPVLSAIGHEFDQSSVQDVSSLSFGVPKDLGHFLSRRIIDLRLNIETYRDEILRSLKDIVRASSDFLNVKVDSVRTRGTLLLKDAYALVLQIGLESIRKASDILGKKEVYLQTSADLICVSSRFRCVNMWQVINNSYLPLVDLSKRIYGDNIKVISNLESIFKLVSPEAQLDRGFAIIRTKDGQLLKRAENFNKFDELEIQMCDGNIKAKVIGD
jgi:exodeoxyribonuclease VII large subunit